MVVDRARASSATTAATSSPQRPHRLTVDEVGGEVEDSTSPGTVHLTPDSSTGEEDDDGGDYNDDDNGDVAHVLAGHLLKDETGGGAEGVYEMREGVGRGRTRDNGAYNGDNDYGESSEMFFDGEAAYGYRHDEADDENGGNGESEMLVYTPEEERAVVRKFDRRLVLFVALLYLLSFLDRSSEYPSLPLLQGFFGGSRGLICLCLVGGSLLQAVVVPSHAIVLWSQAVVSSGASWQTNFPDTDWPLN